MEKLQNGGTKILLPQKRKAGVKTDRLGTWTEQLSAEKVLIFFSLLVHIVTVITVVISVAYSVLLLK